MTPQLRKFALLAHITFSVGWFGAVVPYIALVIAGLTSHDVQLVRSVYLSMELIGWYVIVPCSFAAMLSGLVQSLGTQWGLFRHWWVLTKFLLTIVAIPILLRHMQDVSRVVARMEQGTMLSTADFRPDLIHAVGGLLVLFVAMTLSVFKPWGMTPYGRHRASQAYTPSNPTEVAEVVREPVFVTRRPRWGRIIGIHAMILAVVFVIFHLTGGGLPHH